MAICVPIPPTDGILYCFHRTLPPSVIGGLISSLEVFEITGQSLTALTDDTETTIPYRITKLILSPFDRPVLHQRIANRYRVMMAEGFLEEVTALYQQPGFHAELPSMRAVGYRQVWQYLSGDFDLDTCIEKAIIATRQMAKRQLTWLRAQDDGSWFDSGEEIPLPEIMAFLTQNVPELNNNT